MIEIRPWSSAEIRQHLAELAQLRITIFREYPYLYDGTMSYEQHYLERYARCSEAQVWVLQDQGRVVGAVTGLPLWAEDAEFQAPFMDEPANIRQWFYIGEVLLLPPWRGLGYGSRLLNQMLQNINVERYPKQCLYTVQAPERLKPVHYRAFRPEAFGFVQHPSRKAYVSWQCIDETEPSVKTLDVWEHSSTELGAANDNVTSQKNE